MEIRAPLFKPGGIFLMLEIPFCRPGTSFLEPELPFLKSGVTFYKSGTPFCKPETSFCKFTTPYINLGYLFPNMEPPASKHEEGSLVIKARGFEGILTDKIGINLSLMLCLN